MAEKWKVKKGDKVCILAGKDKGKTGTILKVLREDRRVLVEGVNLVTRHVRPNAAHPEGGRIQKEASLHVSNVAHVDPASGKPTRVGLRLLDDGKKVRYAKRSGDLIDR